MDGEKLFCVWYNKGEKYWDKCYNVQGAEDQKLRWKKMMGKVP